MVKNLRLVIIAVLKPQIITSSKIKFKGVRIIARILCRLLLERGSGPDWCYEISPK